MKNALTYLTILAFLAGSAVSAQVVNNEEIIVEPGATLIIEKGGLSNVDGGKVENQGLIDIQGGDWLNDSNSVYSGNGNLKFSGDESQTMEHYMHALGNDTIGNLTIDKPSGDVYLRSDVLLTKDLILTSGNLWLFDTTDVSSYGGNIELYGTLSYTPGTMIVTSNEDGSRQHYLAWKNVQQGTTYEMDLAYVNSQGELVDRTVKISTETIGCCVHVAVLPGVWENPETKQVYVLDDVAKSTLKLYSPDGGTVDVDLAYNSTYETGTDFADGTETVSGLYWKEGLSTAYEELTTSELTNSYLIEDVELGQDTIQYLVLADEESDLIQGLILSMTAWLQGPYSSGAMTNALRSSELIPTSAADNAVYGGTTWNYDGSEAVASPQDLPSNAVDWVLIELRDAPTAADATASTTAKTVAGIILTDGSIVGTNGNPISIKGVEIQDNLYVVLRHRNHLDVMSAGNLTTNANGEFEWDFTESNSAYGTNALADLGNGEYGLIAGDVNADGIVKFTGAANDKAVVYNALNASTNLNNTISGYSINDVNMDGIVKFTGSGNDKAVIYNVLDASTNLNNTRSLNVPQ